MKKYFSKSYLPAMLGACIEYYDIALYGYMAPILVPVFLPHFAKTKAYFIYFFFEVFAVVCQIFGARFFGKMGDRQGRKKAMYCTMLGTSCATFAISVVPTYETAGLLAAFLFALFRALQCFFLGGEYNGGAIYCLEHEADKSKYGLVSGLYCALTVAGIVGASVVATLVNSLGSGYFRLAYAISFLLAASTYQFRRKITETPEFFRANESNVSARPWFSHRQNFIALMMGSLFFGMLYGLTTRIFNALLPLAIGIEGHLIMVLNTAFLIVYLILLVLFGLAADRFGIEKVMRTAILATIFLSYPLILLIETKTIFGLIVAKASFAVLTAAFIGPFHAWAQGLFETQSRYQQVSTAYAAGKCCSTFLLASTIMLYEQFQSLSVIACVLIFCALFTRRFLYVYQIQPLKTLSHNEY